MYIGQTFSAFRAQVYSSDKLRGWISWLLIFLPILKGWCFLNFRIDMLKSKLLGISSLAKQIRLGHVLLTSLYQEDEIQPQVRAALWECIFQIRSRWSLTGEVISRGTKSTISSFSPVSQKDWLAIQTASWDFSPCDKPKGISNAASTEACRIC